MSAKEGVRPILALYRGILRAHYRRLPTPMRVLGDSYAREEFRRHLEGKTTHDQWIEFGSEWSKYLASIDPADGSEKPNLSGDLSPDVVAAMTDEQRAMLERLREEATRFGGDVDVAPDDDDRGRR